MALSQLQLKKFEKTFDNKTVIFKQGGDGTDLYVMVKGSVSVLVGIKKVAEIREPGTYFGEMSMLLGQPRSATIVTNEVSTFLIIPPQSLGAIINEAGLKLAKTLAQRIKDTTDKLVKSQDEKTTMDLRYRSEYQKLVKVVACVQMQSKLPQVKSLLDYSKKASTLATGGAPPVLDDMHMDDFLKKAVAQFKNKV